MTCWTRLEKGVWLATWAITCGLPLIVGFPLLSLADVILLWAASIIWEKKRTQ